MNLIEIERFAIHDGPGIRTVVFLQGCPLRCPWCSNPESQVVGSHLMHDEKKCARCGSCAAVCPKGYISLQSGSPSPEGGVWGRLDCADCTLCVDACPQDALTQSGIRRSVDEVMQQILRDKDYYEASGGGVTFSGGEAMMQPDALLSLLKACKAAGIHTAVETCGQVPQATIESVLPWVDLFLFDVKHTDAERLKQTVRGDWNLIRTNLRRIAQSAPAKVIVRVPCIPGFNLTEQFFDSLFSLMQQLNLRRVELLPYHALARDKYRRLGLPYTSPQTPLKREALIPYKEKAARLNLQLSIG